MDSTFEFQYTQYRAGGPNKDIPTPERKVGKFTASDDISYREQLRAILTAGAVTIGQNVYKRNFISGSLVQYGNGSLLPKKLSDPQPFWLA